MAVPRAHPGGLYDSGTFPTQPHVIDIAGAINAITQGAGSLIHGAVTRKIAERNYQLQLTRLQQEGELHRAQLDALTAYRQAQLGNTAQRIAAPGARAQQQQKEAFNTLAKQFPTHSLVAPAEDGTPAEFDPDVDYRTPLKDAMGAKAAADKETARHADQLDTLNKAATLRAWVNTQAEKQRAAAKSAAGPSPAQQRAAKNDFLTRLAALSGGDPDKAEAIIANDKDVAAAASGLGVQSYEARAAAAAVGTKNAAAQTRQNIQLESSGMVPGSKAGTAATPADINAARSGLTVPTPDAAKPAQPSTPITPLVTPRAGASPSSLNPNASAPIQRLPRVPNGPVAPAAVGGAPPTLPAPLVTPGAPPASAQRVPAAGAPIVPAPLATPGVPKPTAAIDESTLGDADLWELKRKGGMTADAATAYVKARKAPVAAGVPAPVVKAPEDDDDTLAPAA